MVIIRHGDCRDILPTLEASSINCCVTSPPYFGLRDYGIAGQIGLERTPEEYVLELVACFREVRRVLKDNGTLWLNIGDSYNAAGRKGHGTREGCQFKQGTNRASAENKDQCLPTAADLKPKDLIGIPWRVVFALQADGWYLRADIIWHKPNPMPESVTDRPTKAHEYLFLMAKSERYYYDSYAIQEPQSEHERTRRLREQRDGLKTKYTLARDTPHGQHAPGASGCARSVEARQALAEKGTRNKRSVWTVPTNAYTGAHFATFPPALIRPCILAGCPMGGTVLDPFGGSGTTGEVAEQEGRNSILIELNPQYVELVKRRTRQGGLFCQTSEIGGYRDINPSPIAPPARS